MKKDKPPVTIDEMRQNIHRTMREVLEVGGITDEFLQKKLKKELLAHEVKTYVSKGQIIYSEPLVAWDIRQRARQDAHRLRGDYPAEKHELDTHTTVQIVDFAKDDKK